MKKKRCSFLRFKGDAMIWIITGASHAGKTFLAQRMLEKFMFPYLSIDHLKMGLIRSGYTDFTPEDGDVPLMNEKRTGHVNLMTKEDWNGIK